MFTIQTHHGKGTIRLVKNLDYETKSLYQLRVLAVDRANQGPVNTGTAAILVKVRDVEDVSDFEYQKKNNFRLINPENIFRPVQFSPLLIQLLEYQRMRPLDRLFFRVIYFYLSHSVFVEKLMEFWL